MKKLLCIMALLVAFQPDVFAQRHTQTQTTVTKRTTVVHGPRHTTRKTVVVRHRPHAERRVVVRHRHGPPMVRCRDGVLKRDRPGACRGHGGRR